MIIKTLLLYYILWMAKFGSNYFDLCKYGILLSKDFE